MDISEIQVIDEAAFLHTIEPFTGVVIYRSRRRDVWLPDEGGWRSCRAAHVIGFVDDVPVAMESVVMREPAPEWYGEAAVKVAGALADRAAS